MDDGEVLREQVGPPPPDLSATPDRRAVTLDRRAGPAADESLLAELRRGTRHAHQSLDVALRARASVATVADYAVLLGRLQLVHLRIETALTDASWTAEWLRLGVRIGDHLRGPLIAEDLAALADRTGHPPSDRPAGSVCPLRLQTFGEHLGCLYVAEGSALGGPPLAALLESVLGPLPTAYLRGHGRPRGTPWQTVLRALTTFDHRTTERPPVVRGALATFDLFCSRLAVAQGSPASTADPPAVAPAAVGPAARAGAVRSCAADPLGASPPRGR